MRGFSRRILKTQHNHDPKLWKLLPFDELVSTPDLALLIQGNLPEISTKNCLPGLYSRSLRLQIPESWRHAIGPLRNLTGPSSLLLDLPMDVLMEIFSHLHPLDLYRLCMTCAQLRQFLLNTDRSTNQDARLTWRRSFARNPGIPSRPSGFTTLKWVTFLFGPAICESRHCGKGGAQLYLGVSRKYCDKCAEENLITVPEAQKLCKMHYMVHIPVDHSKTLSMCHQAYRIDLRRTGTMTTEEQEKADHERGIHENARPPGPAERAYLQEELEANISITCLHCTQKRHGVPDAVKIFKKIGWERAQKVKQENLVAAKAFDWVGKLKEEEWKSQRYWYIQKLYKEGKKYNYNDLDLRDARQEMNLYFASWSVRGMRQKDFKHHFSHLLPMIERHRDQRLQDESKSTCLTYYHTLLPVDCFHFPYAVTWEVLKNSPFPASLLEWRTNMRNKLLRKLLDAPSPIFQSVPQDLVLKDSGDSPLELAAAVFSCQRCLSGHYIGAALVGWEALSFHMCSNLGSLGPELHLVIERSAQGHENALLLIASLGLDPHTATVQDMDEVDARWFCGNCELRRADGISFRKALKWRECLTHSVYCVDSATHAAPSWLLLGKEVMHFVKGRERPYPSPNKNIWGCAHCQEHIHWALKYPEVEQHVKDIHRIRDPQNGRDVIPMMNRFAVHSRGANAHVARKAVLYQTNPPMKYHCLRCPPIPHEKFWIGDEIFKHLRDRHHIPDITQGRDWETFDIYQ